MGRIKSVLILCALIAIEFLPGATALAGDTRAITLDNDFSDWSGAVALATDPSGDVAGGEADFTQVFVADDNERLYFRFDTTREFVLLESNPVNAGNDLRIFIDGDGSAATGMLIDGVGVDLEIRVGSRQAFYYSGGTTNVSLNEVGFVGLPTHSGFEFEIQVPFAITPGFGAPVSVITGPTVNIFIREDQGGDRVPDTGTMTYTLDGTPVAAPAVTSFSKVNASDVRLLVHNVLGSGLVNPGRQPAFIRALQALDPDIALFTELSSPTTTEVVNLMESILPAGPGEAWNARKRNDAVTVSRWPIVNFANVDGNLLCEIDPPADRSFRNLIIFNAHTPCCVGGNPGRDTEHDRISSTWRNLLNGVGPFAIDVTSPVFMVGDFNMVGFVRQLETLRDGVMIDGGTFGADFSPGRTNGSLVSAPVRHSHTRSTYSWRNDGSPFSAGKLDYILFSDDAATLQRNFTLWTPDMDSGSLAAAGLQSADSPTMSDHLVMIADFSLSLVPVELSRFEID